MISDLSWNALLSTHMKKMPHDHTVEKLELLHISFLFVVVATRFEVLPELLPTTSTQVVHTFPPLG